MWRHIAVRETLLENRMCHCDSTALSLPVRPAVPGYIHLDSRSRYWSSRIAVMFRMRPVTRLERWRVKDGEGGKDMGWEIYEMEMRGGSEK